MMTKLLGKVTQLVADELEESNKNHPPKFYSTHEGYGVIAEELSEARDEEEWVDLYFRELLGCLKLDDVGITSECALNLKKAAVDCACELIQVAAMCDKMIESL